MEMSYFITMEILPFVTMEMTLCYYGSVFAIICEIISYASLHIVLQFLKETSLKTGLPVDKFLFWFRRGEGGRWGGGLAYDKMAG